MTTSYEFNTPPTLCIGGGVSDLLPEHVLRSGSRKVMFVTDPYLVTTGLIDHLVMLLHRQHITSVVFSKVQPDPTVRNVEDGLALFRSSGADLLVAVGGGSPLDAAKAIAILATNEAPLSRYMGYHKIPLAGIPLIAIPTTAGTGSEASKVAVITDTERNVKMMMLDRHLMPTTALIDYKLSESMPRALTAYVGVDTLTHGIEAYVSGKANPMTDPIALSCIRLTARYLIRAWEQPDDEEARAAMALAACQGGMAFTNSSVCLVHGMSRPLGAVFHLAHGLSNAILLPVVTRFSVAGAPARYATVSRTMGLASDQDGDESACRKLAEGLEALNRRLEIPSLKDCPGMEQGRFESVLEKMADDALASGSPQNNPVVPGKSEIVALYRQAW